MAYIVITISSVRNAKDDPECVNADFDISGSRHKQPSVSSSIY